MTKHIKKPNVFLAGAPKCGTTSFAHWLGTHPQCYVSPKKEPHFFGDFMRNGMETNEYEKLFFGASENHAVRIDASTSYFTKPEAISQILDYNPEARFIIMLRNPIELAYSLHAEVLYGGAETINSFEKAWHLQEARRNGRKIPISCQNPEMLLYRDQALLGSALQNLLAQAGKDRVHWIFLEDLKKDPRQCYLDVVGFLGLEDDGRNEFPSLNRSKRHRFPVLNRVLRTIGRMRSATGLPGIGIRKTLNQYAKVEAERPPLRENFKREIYESFRDDIKLLAGLTNRNLSHWTPQNL